MAAGVKRQLGVLADARPRAASWPLWKNLAPTSLLLQSTEPLKDGPETHPPRNLPGGRGGSDGSAAKDARPSGYTPVSMTPMTT